MVMRVAPISERNNRLSRRAAYVVLCAALAGTSIALARLAQAQEPASVDLTGVWSTNSLDTLENPGWDIFGLLSCRCATETYDYLDTILHDPAYDYMDAQDIIAALEAHTDEVIADRLTDHGRAVGEAFDLADDPAIQCERFPTFRTVLHSDPIEFEYHDGYIVIRGEDLTVDRTVYMDGRGHPENLQLSAQGHSIGWYEDGVLVIETVGVTPGLVDDQLALHSSEQARGVERYWLGEDRRQLNAEFTLHDPIMLKSPLMIRRPRVWTPDVELDRRPCEAIAGQF